MKRITVLALTALATVTLAATAVAETGAQVVAAAASPTIKITKTALGKIIVTGSGFTAYEFTADRRNKDVCATRSGCTGTWPPLTVKGKPTAGRGVNSRLLGTIKLAHGVTQVTYAGHPLYRYDLDSPGSTDYVGAKQYGGSWYALTSTGKTIK
jgi:predicted lipoprotein with Yx(FWY)xxD motif